MSHVPASKRQRVDPHALDDDSLPPMGTSVLGKRFRIQDNSYYYPQSNADAVIRGNRTDSDNKTNDNDNDTDLDMSGNNNNNINNNNNNGLPSNNISNNNMNNNNNFGENNGSGWSNPPIKFVKGCWIDIQIMNDDEQDFQWITGIMIKEQENKVHVYVPRHQTFIFPKTSKHLAPVGTHTEGFENS